MDNDLTYLAGGEIREVRPLPPYSEIVVKFLDDYSAELLHDSACKSYPDITAVAFWARKGNIARLKAGRAGDPLRLGRGLAFHITPSNIPVQFIFSYMFGLLSGCANVVKVTSKDYPQIELLCNVLMRVLERDEYKAIRAMTAIVRYPRESNWTEDFSAKCQARLIWGGDATIENIRKCPLPPRAVELVFPDRYSLAIFDGEAIAHAEEKALRRLAQDFYNDTFMMDQNACSSPQLILWQGHNENGKKRFWATVRELAKKRYNLAPVKATGKYADFCTNAVRFPETGKLVAEDNILYRVSLKEIPQNVDELRGKFGLFYEYDVQEFAELGKVVNGRYQTLTYFGIDSRKLVQFVLEHQWLGIDRIVPVGKALDMDVVWDGYDLVSELSRIIDVR